MKVNKYKINLENESIIDKFKNYNIVSIETTGLSKYKDTIISYASLEIKEDTELTVFTTESLTDELSLINSVDINNKKIITYNGDRFSLPFIEEKMKLYKKDKANYESFDLYKYIKNYKIFLPFDNYKQINIEKFLDIKRKEDIEAKDISKLYKKYLLEQDNDSLDKITRHNKENVLSLFKMLEITDYIEKKKSFEIYNYSFDIEEIKFDENTMLITGKTTMKNDCEFNKLNYSFVCRDNNFKIEVIYSENYYDKDNKCKYVFSNEFLNIEMPDKIFAPENIYIIYYKKTLINNIIFLIKTIIKMELSVIIK